MLATKEKPHPGFQLPAVASHPAFTLAISHTATSLTDPLYENRSGPLCSGYFRDSETGLDYAVNRYHQPGMGRFLTMDQANASPGEPATWNRYAYAGGDPANNVDPSGMYTQAQCEQNPQSCQGPPPGSGISNCASAGGEFFDYYDPNCQTQNCPASIAEEFFGNVNADPSADCQDGTIASSQPTAATCSDWGCMPPAYARAIQALTLNPDCMNLFGNAQTRNGKFNPVTVLTNIIYGSHSFGQINFKNMGPGNSAVTAPAGMGIGLITGKVTITINEYTAPGFDYWNAGNTGENAETLLHELAHAYTLIRGSGGFNGTRFISDASLDLLIQTDCFPGGTQ